MQSQDQFNWRSPKDYALVMMGVFYYTLKVFVCIVQAIPNMDGVNSTPRGTRTTRTRTHQVNSTKPTITRSRRWVKSLGRYQITYHNRATGVRHTTPRMKDLTGLKS
jgi:hypothetical protein